MIRYCATALLPLVSLCSCVTTTEEELMMTTAAAEPPAAEKLEAAEGEVSKISEAVLEPADPAADEAAVRERALEGYRNMVAGLRGVRWQTRTTMPVAGQFTVEVLHKLRSDENGDLVRVVSDKRRRSAVSYSGMSAPLTEEEAIAFAEKLADLAQAYVFAPGGVFQRITTDGTLIHGIGSKPATLSLTEAVMPGDRAEYKFVHLTGEPKELHFETNLDGKIVQAVATYRELPDGVSYPSRVVLEIPDLPLKATVESFGWAPEVNR